MKSGAFGGAKVEIEPESFGYVSLGDCLNLPKRSTLLYSQQPQQYSEYAFLQSELFNLLDVNQFGFGRELNFDSNEFVLLMKTSKYQMPLILQAVAIAQEHNCQHSLV